MSLAGILLLAALAANPPPPELHFIGQAAGTPITAPPRLGLSLGGPTVRATVDTGSTGVVVSAGAIPNLDQQQTLGPGELTYSSSGRIERGVWVRMPVTLTGANGYSVTTRPVLVLAVTAVDCTVTARSCKTVAHPEHVAMVGIGFGREHDHQAHGTPENNPLLNLDGEAGRLRLGYTVRRDGIVLGAPDLSGFASEQLAYDTEFRDWKAPQACIRLDDGPEACGHVLVDTGVTRMFMAIPSDRLAGHNSGSTLSPGVRVAITFGEPTGAGERPAYGFIVGGPATPVAPTDVVLSGDGRRPTFVNTGVHLLNRYDIGFDAEGGRFGYRPRGD